MIAFLVADRPFLQDKEKTVAKEEAQEWVFGGLNQLPADIKRDVWTDNHACTALVYEFHQPAVGEDVSVRAPSPVSGKQHLQRSEILASLKRTRP